MIEPQERHIYELHASRNLLLGVYQPAITPLVRGEYTLSGFIGIRTKFESRFLTTEHGLPVRDLGPIPDERIRLWEKYPGSMCSFCGAEVAFRTPSAWEHVTPRMDCYDPHPIAKATYWPLFQLLEDLEEDLRTKEAPC